MALLQKTVDLVESEKRDQATKIEFLERINDDKNQELNRTKSAMDRKIAQIEDLHIQVKRVKEDTEKTQSLKLND